MKKLLLNRDKCIGCAICSQILPDAFEMNSPDGKASLVEQPLKKVQTAVFPFISDGDLVDITQKCPVNAIHIV